MLEGFSTVLCAFFVFCLYRQDLIKNRTYYYATFGCLIAIIFCNVFFYYMAGVSGQGFFAVFLGILHVGALVLTMAYVGGLSVRQIGFEVVQAAEDVRSGGEAKKPVIVPLTREQPKPKDAYVEEERGEREKPRIVIELPKKGDDRGSIPVD
jgi:hypothetical protein